METQSVTLTEFRQNLSDIINRVACGDVCIVLASRGRAKAALISPEDLRRLVALEQAYHQQRYVQQQREALEAARSLRERMAMADAETDSTTILAELREERTDELLGLR